MWRLIAFKVPHPKYNGPKIANHLNMDPIENQGLKLDENNRLAVLD